MKKKTSSRYVIASIVLIFFVLVCLIFFLETRIHREESPKTPAVQETVVSREPPAMKPAIIESAIKGCLFDMDITRAQLHVKGHTIIVDCEDSIPQRRIQAAFRPFDKTARVEVHPERVSLSFERGVWTVIFRQAKKPAARIAIIVDDMGLDMRVARKLAAIDADLTFSVMPLRPYTKQVQRYLHAHGKETLMHLPMQGNGKNPGAGAIYKGMSPAEIRSILSKDLRSVGNNISGVNNHMGSKATADAVIMRTVFQELKKRNLFFIDSLTTSRSVCRQAASDTGMAFNARDTFLDNVQSDKYIVSQLDKLISIARKYPDAIGICHPHPATIEVLTREIPRLKKKGVDIVRVSSLVEYP